MSQENKNNEKTVVDTAPKTVGIPSVAAKRKSSPKPIWIYAAVLVVCLISFVGYGLFQKFQEPSNAPQPENTRSVAGHTLVLPPISEISPKEPAPPPEVIVQKEPEKEVTVKEAPAAPIFSNPPAIPQNQSATVIATQEKKEPTLAEKRNMAPMMGEPNSIAKDVGEGKGLAQTLREEGYGSGGGGKLGGLLSSVSTPATKASMMPDRNLLLAKGTFIDCILETKLDTTVPGMTSCIIPQDIYSANGKVLLIEKGSKAIGEYTGAVENGLNRIFVLWTQVQTPNGVRVNLNSPATDSLGGSGLSGHVDFHWWARFGNALLFTLIQDGFDFAMNKTTENNGGVNYYQNSQDGMEEIIKEAMRQAGNIPPTLTKNQGERIGIFVARDVDFSSVYKLKPIK